MKEQYRQPESGKIINNITFGMLSEQDMAQQAHIEVVNKELNQPGSRQPAEFSPLDNRMGTSGKQSNCGTCGKTLADCTGHFGYVDLEYPCFHVGFLATTASVLQKICKTCSRLLLTPEQRIVFQNRLQRPDCTYLAKKALHKEILVKCKKHTFCLHCSAVNGVVKKCGMLLLIHDKYKQTTVKPSESIMEFHNSFDDAIQLNKDIEQLLTKTQEALDPGRVLQIFEAIPTEDLPFLLMNSGKELPRDLILTRLPVAPLCIRPSVVSDLKVGTNEDDITVLIKDILIINDDLRKHKKTGKKTSRVRILQQYLQVQVAHIFNGEVTGVPFDMQRKDKKYVRGFSQRLKGKAGRFRCNLSGKRVDFSGRTVISPDPNMRIDQVAVPRQVAKILTYPEKVTHINIEYLRSLVLNGPDVHPGANTLERVKEGRKVSLRYANRKEVAKYLHPGDIVLRHLKDGDIILFNRQPSLHKLSIQAFYAKVMPHRTFRFNECCCNPFNADFDGDEMNIHVPQTEEARAEAIILMGSKSNMVTPRNGEPLIAAIQDFITASYLLTLKDVFFDRFHATQLAASMLAADDVNMRVDLPPPAIFKPTRLWTGKQIFSLILRPSRTSQVVINLRAKGKSYSQKNEDLCCNDSYCVISNSELMCGTMDKSTLGSGSKNNVFYLILHQCGEMAAAGAMSRLARLTPAYLTQRGFSIGIGDVIPGTRLDNEKEQMLQAGYSACDTYIQQLHQGQLRAAPGCTVDETLEAMSMKELSDIRERGGTACTKSLHKTNSPLTMAICGSKGSNINISQMIVCVGQQAINGKRIPDGFTNRSLPHFEEHSKTPAAKGFVSNSFYSGLTPTEFFMHTMAGREGLVDTAVKTADTGYMQRRLVKVCEDLYMAYDETVRTSTAEIVQFKYGADGLDPTNMEGDDQPINFASLYRHTLSAVPHTGEVLSGDQFLKQAVKLIGPKDSKFQKCHTEFIEALRTFLVNVSDNITKARNKFSGEGVNLPVAYQVERVTDVQLESFMSSCLTKYQRARMEPGSAVGATCAQSIGEPATQMTLKTFHFAGVASMNITQGVPRIKEVINAAKKISTPVVTAELVNESDEAAAYRVKGRVEKVTLDGISKYIDIVHEGEDCYLRIKLDLERIERLKLEINMCTVVSAILASKLKIKPKDISDMRVDRLHIFPNSLKKSSTLYALLKLRTEIQAVMVKGLPSVTRAVIHRDEKGGELLKLLVEGKDLRGVMATPGINGTRTKSNDIMETGLILGIEAARTTIIKEILETMGGHGIKIDIRHLMLLASLMTFRGEVLGITRFGMAKMKESVLMLASFESTTDHLYEAACYGQKDDICGVSESIILGIPMKLGTGLFKLLEDQPRPSLPKRPLFFDCGKFHRPGA